MWKSQTVSLKKDGTPDYSKYIGKKVVFLTVCAAVLILIVLIALSIGSANLTISEVVDQLINQSGIAWSIRFPRVLVAVVAGAMLAVAGTVMQCILKNPLSEPYTLGLSQAAAFGAAFAIVILGAGATFSNAKDAVVINNQYAVTICAFCFSLISTGVVIVLTRLTRVSPEAIVLSGVVMGSVFAAARTAVQYFASDVQIASIVYWTFGDLSRITWDNLILHLQPLELQRHRRWNRHRKQPRRKREQAHRCRDDSLLACRRVDRFSDGRHWFRGVACSTHGAARDWL